MKFLFLWAAFAFPFFSQALEFTIQSEDDQIRISKVKMLPGDEVGLHRDENYRFILAIQGGAVTRIEEDGSTNKVEFPTGVSVFLKPDPKGQLHKTINNSKNEIEIIVMELKNYVSKNE